MSPACVTITQLEPVVFLRGQSASGEDARGRRRPVNFDAPPSQLRALVTLNLPKPSKIKEINVSLTGTARTDWPEGIGPNRLETVEEVTIFQHSVTLYNAKTEPSYSGRPRSNSVGPGIGLVDDVDWEHATAAHASSSNTSRPSLTPTRREDSRSQSSAGSGSNIARQIAEAAAKAGTAIIPPTLRPDLGLAKPKDSNGSRNRPSLNRTGSGTTSWSAFNTDSYNISPTQTPAVQPHSASPSYSPDATRNETSRDQSSRHDLDRWHDYFEARGQERPPLYAPRSAPLDGYDTWPANIVSATPASYSPTDTAALSPVDSTSAATVPAASSQTNATPPSRSILHSQPGSSVRPGDHTVRFDPQYHVDQATPSAQQTNGRSTSKSTPTHSRRGSVETVEPTKNVSRSKTSGRPSIDNKMKKAGLKNLIQGLLKEPDSRPNGEDSAGCESKEFKKGTYTYPISISLPSNLPPTLHADFGFNRYVFKVNVVRSGALTPNLIAEREITLIHAPDEDALDETDSIVVERCWEDVLSYMVVFSGKSFPIGQKIPLWLKLVPLGKVKIHRILATLEERTDYFAKGRRVARHEVPRKWTLLKLAQTSGTAPILPIMSDSADALDQSPIAPLARAAAGEDAASDKIPSILDPTGPWELATDLLIPACGTTRINLSTNHTKSNIAVHHMIRLAIRVEKPEGVIGDGSQRPSSSNMKEDHKLYDIVIEAPITLTSSHTAVEWTSLPNYWDLPAEPTVGDASNSAASDLQVRPNMPSPVLTSRTGSAGGHSGGPVSPPLARLSSQGGQPARNPAQSSRRWLALSADQIGRDGNTNPSNNATEQASAPPPPAYRPNAQHGETIVSATAPT